MAMEDEVKIEGTDVTDYRISWKVGKEWDGAIDGGVLILSRSVTNVLTPSVGNEFTIKRGFVTPTDKTILSGQITQILPSAEKFTLILKNPVYDAVKSGRTKSWDKNIDTEAGVGSEIFKSLADNSGISYTSASVPTTGTADADKINKFIQNDEDDFQKMNELAKRYNRIITYDYDNSIINFFEKGYTTYGTTLNVGTEIPRQIQWKENMEQMCNKVKVFGATVRDTKNETFAGPATTFTLGDTPEDTEVRQGNETGTLYVRGQKDVGILGTDFDYYVDEEQSQIIFASNKSNIWVRYGAQVPMPVIVKNQTSIDAYGGPNKKPHFKRLDLTDVKDVADAEDRGRKFIEKYSTPFIQAEKVPIVDDIIETYGDILPGYVLNVVDTYTNKDVTVFVQSVEMSWPHVYDTITIGDEIWRTESWQSDQMQKINQIFAHLNKNQSIIITTFDLDRTFKYEKRYTDRYKIDRSSDGVDTFILNSPVFGVLGTQKLGDAGTAEVLNSRIQGKNIYKEFVYDDDFFDSSNSSGTDWDTTNKDIEIIKTTDTDNDVGSDNTFHVSNQYSAGMKIQATVNCTITHVIKDSNCTASRCLIYDNSKVLLDSQSFSGADAYFRSGVAITKDSYYYVVVDNSGGSYNHTHWTGISFPVTCTDLNYVARCGQNPSWWEDTAEHKNIDSITTDKEGILYTEVLSLGVAYSYYTVEFYSSLGANTTVEISGDGKSTWETVTQDTRTAFASSDGTGIYLRISVSTGSQTLENSYTTGGRYDAPAIKITLEE